VREEGDEIVAELVPPTAAPAAATA
jgi:hypothetical protein